jgi:predicted RNase H-like HicB family nuclease
MQAHNFTAMIYKEDDMYIAECPEILALIQTKKMIVFDKFIY